MLDRLIKLSLGALLTSATVVSGVLLDAGPAHAAVHCASYERTHNNVTYYYQAECSGSTTQVYHYRVVAHCPTYGGTTQTIYGEWEYTGYSTVVCPESARATRTYQFAYV